MKLDSCTKSALILSGAFVLVSCASESPTALSSASVVSDAVPTQASGAIVGNSAHQVSGGGAIWRSDLGVWYYTTVTARFMPDGSASGNWHYWVRARELRSRIFVKVSCLTVVGNEAWMVGQSTQAEAVANIGKWFGLHVVDNGEGHGVADVMSNTLWFGTDAAAAAAFCTGSAPSADWPLADGNLQVR
jgi:hypothetical protein